MKSATLSSLSPPFFSIVPLSITFFIHRHTHTHKYIVISSAYSICVKEKADGLGVVTLSVFFFHLCLLSFDGVFIVSSFFPLLLLVFVIYVDVFIQGYISLTYIHTHRNLSDKFG